MANQEKILMLIDEMIKEAQEEPQWKAESALKCLKKELLKEQEPIKAVKRVEETEWNVCGNCNNHIISKWKWCPYCGRGVKWDV